jgi:hypothetical protein
VVKTGRRASHTGADDAAGRITFARERPHAAVIPDYIRIELEDTPPGRYRPTMRVTDVVGGRALERMTTFQIQ